MEKNMTYENLKIKLRNDREKAYEKYIKKVNEKKELKKSNRKSAQKSGLNYNNKETKLVTKPNITYSDNAELTHEQIHTDKTDTESGKVTENMNTEITPCDVSHDVSVLEDIVIQKAQNCDPNIKIKPPKRKASNSNSNDINKIIDSNMIKRKMKLTKKKKKMSESGAKKNRERVQRFRQNMTSEQLEDKRKKDRDRYKRKKEQGLVKCINEHSKREKRHIRKIWKRASQTYRQNKNERNKQINYLESNTPPDSDIDMNTIQETPRIPHSVKKIRGRKKVKRDRTKTYKALQIANSKIEILTKRVEKYKKRLYRSTSTAPCSSKDSPNTKVRLLTRNLKVSPAIRNRLLFAEVLESELVRNVESVATSQDKQLFCKAVSGELAKKYKMIGTTRQFVSYKMHLKHRKNFNLSQYQRKKRNSELTENARKLIRNFLERDVNSRMCSGKKEYIKKGKVTKQKRLLQETMRNLHVHFLNTKVCKVSYATFCRLKPFWIIAAKQKDRETCSCVKHENMSLIVAKLYNNNIIPEKQLSLIISQTVCNPEKKVCMTNECSSCKNRICQINKAIVLSQPITYQQWCSIVEIREVKNQQKQVRRTVKKENVTTVGNLIKELNKQLPAFKKHVFYMRHQLHEMQKKKSFVGPDELILQIDFAENYVAKYNLEIQSMHFGASKKQISLHTGLYYFHDSTSNTVQNRSFCSISNHLDHQAYGVWAHLEELLMELAQNFPKVTTINFFSDGPTSQYRNRTNIYFLLSVIPLLMPNVQNISWNFSESGHGKGPMDGIGGTLKRSADRLVLQGKDIYSASCFIKNLSDISIKMWEVTETKIDEYKNKIPAKIPPIPNIMSIHQVTWSKQNNSKIFLRSLSCFSCQFNIICKHHLMKQSSVIFPRQDSGILLYNTNIVSCKFSIKLIFVHFIDFLNIHLDVTLIQQPSSRLSHINLLSDILVNTTATSATSLDTAENVTKEIQLQVKNPLLFVGICYLCTRCFNSENTGIKCIRCKRTFHGSCIIRKKMHAVGKEIFECIHCLKLCQ